MHVVVNAAASADGKLSTRRREQVTISGPDDFARVDRLRAASDAVLVGVGTVLADDPSLTVKSEERVVARRERGDTAQPTRVVADSHVRTPPDAQVLDDAAETVLLVSESAPPDSLAQMQSRGATVIAAGADRVDLATALRELEEHGIERLLVEGGGELIYSLFAEDLVDRLSVYVASFVVGGADAPTLVDGVGFTGEFPALSLDTVERIDDGVLLTYDVA